jgi:hypothetical protein
MNQQGGWPWQSMTEFTNAPNGEAFWTAEWLPGSLITISGWLISTITGEVCAYSIMVFIGFVASAVAMYALALHVSKSRFYSTLAGLAYGMGGYAYIKATRHLEYVHSWTFPLLILLLLLLYRKRSTKYAVLVGIVAGITCYTGPYIPIYLIIIFGAYLSVLLVRLMLKPLRPGSGGQLLRLGLSCAIWFALVAPLVITIALSRATAGQAATVRAAGDIDRYQAHWWYYLFPYRFNPYFEDGFFGRLSDQWIGGNNPGEATLFLGFTFTLAAFAGVILIVWRYRRRILTERLGATCFLLVAIFILSVIFSLGRSLSIMGIEIPLPSGFIYDRFPIWRVTARFGHLALISVLALGAYFFAQWSQWITKSWQKLLLGASAIILTAVDLGFPSGMVLPTFDYGKAPAVYAWLAQQPRGENDYFSEVLHYFGTEEDGVWASWQPIHGWKMTNHTRNDSGVPYPANALELDKDPQFACVVSGLGSKYVVVHNFGYPTVAPPGMTLVKSFTFDEQAKSWSPEEKANAEALRAGGWYDVDVLALDGSKAPAVGALNYGTGWTPWYRINDGQTDLYWMKGITATLSFDQLPSKSGVPSVVSFLAKSNGQPRELQVIQGSKTVWRGTVQPDWSRVFFSAVPGQVLTLLTEPDTPLQILVAGVPVTQNVSIAIASFGVGDCLG